MDKKESILVSGVNAGYMPLFLAKLAREYGQVLHIALSDVSLAWIKEGIAFFAPDVEVLSFPAWDTVPYDRISPNTDIVSERLATLYRLMLKKSNQPKVIVTTVDASIQRVVPKAFFADNVFEIKVGDTLNFESFQKFLLKSGYVRSEQVMTQGEFAVRGGIFDIFPNGADNPLRLDMFGDELESIRSFDVSSQTSVGELKSFAFESVSEVSLSSDSISSFRKKYREMFGSMVAGDVLYESVSEGLRFQGLEHWLPLFYEHLDTLFDYIPDAIITREFQADEAFNSRQEQIADFYDARQEALDNTKLNFDDGFKYRPVPMADMFIPLDEYETCLSKHKVFDFSLFNAPGAISADSRAVHNFADVRASVDADIFLAVANYLNAEIKSGKRAVISCFSDGSMNRLIHLFNEHSVKLYPFQTWEEVKKSEKSKISVVVTAMENGFETSELCIITEQDILGDKLVRPILKKKKKDDFIADVSSLEDGDLVVHIEHGIGRYKGLQAITVGGAPHDCLYLEYADNAKLFVPVENIEVLSRFGSENAGVALDKLGGQAWQARKARLKKRIKDIAEKLMKVAAERFLRKAEVLQAQTDVYEKFVAKFPYMETEDQQESIDSVIADLASGKPMDRLICGDVGFGKTEVAMRAAFVAAISGVQVAMVVPTTLLARQHYETFVERFRNLPIRVAMLSRMVGAKETELIKKGLADGTVDIIIGTHSLLSKNMKYANLGLIIVDEEQHFGVAHKERLKEISSNIHILTLTATPIPRTLQMALSGVRDMSIIATPPVDRLAVRTFVLPFDKVIIRDAILREHFRGGQVFYVCPRVSDIPEIMDTLKELVPEIKAVSAHGQMSGTALEKVMQSFAGRKYDVLVATSIIESGIDMPLVNTIIVHRADMFGLSQLYQLRGRVGRSKTRAYAYLTVPSKGKELTKTAKKRLEIMQTLDSLGEGFNIASYDLDIRGAGNLLGEEQSGHIKEVGIELYQQMLEDAVASLKEGSFETEDKWSPQINTGTPVLIPETYVADLGVRLNLYRRLADLRTKEEVLAMSAELVDRFGKLPLEVENLLDIIQIKVLCRIANIEKIDAGEKGAVITLHNNLFPNPMALFKYIAEQAGTVKVRPDQKIVYLRNWPRPENRVKGLQLIVSALVDLL